jgi:hypothetical protein
MFRSMGGAAFGSLFKATSFTTLTSPSTAPVPSGADAIHIRQAVGGGSAGVNGGSYDKSGGESGGSGGGSGAYISDKIFPVTAGETITFTVGDGGTGNTPLGGPNFIAASGTATTVSGSSTGTVFSLGGSTGGSGTGGSSTPNTGPLRTNNPSVGGTATLTGTPVGSGNFIESNGDVEPIANTTASLRGGILGTFDLSGDGVAGVVGQNCTPDDCQIFGGNGGASYNGSVSGGTPSGIQGQPGSQGSGGSGGGQQPGAGAGGNGGDGEIIYRFIKVL